MFELLACPSLASVGLPSAPEVRKGCEREGDVQTHALIIKRGASLQSSNLSRKQFHVTLCKAAPRKRGHLLARVTLFSHTLAG